MSIETMGAWGEFVGGIAVVLTLIYLAYQTRQNSRQMALSIQLHSSAMATSHAAAFREFWQTIASDEELAGLGARSQTGSGFSEAEVARLEKLGAKRIGAVKSWVVMEAPTGHRFCIVRPQRPDFPADANEWPSGD